MLTQLFRLSLVALALAGNSASVDAQTTTQKGKLSGVIIADYYNVFRDSHGQFRGNQGLWNRRFNLSYDHKFDASWSGRLRIEILDAGNASRGVSAVGDPVFAFSSEHSVDPFMKDAWLRYTANGHKFTFGLISTPTWEAIEDKLGYRPIDKSPLDLYRMGSSRDKGVSLAGPLSADKKADYTLMVGDASSTKASKSGTSAIYGRVGYKASDQVYLNLYADSWRKEKGVRWQTAMIEAFYTPPGAKYGLTYATQRRERPGTPDYHVNVLSFYGEMRLNERVSPFARLDLVSNALPDADKIPYYHMSKAGKPTLIQTGFRYRINKNMEVIPNITFISYGRDLGRFAAEDTIFKLTFHLKF